ncbi:MAG TPA: NAD(P)/FAD-dependent oxidoreductase [Acidimicrobiales bacterium]|nr:NAD(P)/FAD-dependent oxidoreductase [Acidimicrobiales bacterium]
MGKAYDAIVVGARCGGSPTAALLARRGFRVLLVDKARFPSDTLSTHLIHPTGVAALGRWGLLDRVRATGAPAIDRYSLDFGMFRISGAPLPTDDGVAQGFGPRRSVLDDLLVHAAAGAGAEVREGVQVDELVVDDGVVTGIRGHAEGGGSFTEESRVVIGADGRHSFVARCVNAEIYHQRPTFAATYFAYWSGVPVDGLEVYIRPERSFGAFPTNDGLTLVVMSWPRSEFKANRGDVEGNFLKSLEFAPDLATRVAGGRRETRFSGTGDAPGYYRKPFGPGWALVGDAGHHKDPCTAKGMSDAFRDAEHLAQALDDAWSGRAPYERALAAFHRSRDAHTLPMYDFTCQLASLEPPPPETAEVLMAVSASPESSRQFVSVLAGTVALPDFFSAENVARVLAAGSTPITQG